MSSEVFLEPCHEVYVVLRGISLGGRELQAKELVQVTTTKVEETVHATRLRLKSSEGHTGWVAATAVKPWLKSYVARAPQSLEEEGKVLREAGMLSELRDTVDLS